MIALRKNRVVWVLAALAIIAAPTLFITNCKDAGVEDVLPPAVLSPEAAALKAALDARFAAAIAADVDNSNTPSNPYVIPVEVDTEKAFNDGSDPFGILYDAMPNEKYVKYDLSNSAIKSLSAAELDDAITRPNKRFLVSVVLPAGLETIGDYAFYDCSGLAALSDSGVMPISLTSIGSHAFYKCTSLTTLNIPAAVAEIGSYAFAQSGLTTLSLPINTVSEGLFSGCSSLASITTASNITSIGDYAFSGCAALSAFPDLSSVASLGKQAFSGCAAVTALTLPNNISAIPEGCFRDCVGLVSIAFPTSNITIGDYAFYGCAALVALTISDSVTAIGKRAFSACTALVELTLGTGLAIIDDGAFLGCSALGIYYIDEEDLPPGSERRVSNPVVIPANVTKIGDYAFYGCSSLSKFTIESGLQSIGEYAFYNCYNLGLFFNLVTVPSPMVVYVKDPLILPNTLTSIGENAFLNCNSLSSVEIGNGIEEIKAHTFRNCSSLKAVQIGTSVEKIGDYAFSNCINLNYSSYDDAQFFIPANVTDIGDYAFSNCANLTGITLNEGLTKLGKAAFQNCGNLLSIAIPNTLEAIAPETFMECSTLGGGAGEFVIIGLGVSSIGSNAFFDCTGLVNVYMTRITPPTQLVDDSVFKNASADLQIYVPSTGAKTAYENAGGGWNTYKNYLAVGAIPTIPPTP